MHGVPDAETGQVINDTRVTQQRRVRREIANVVLDERYAVAWKTGKILTRAVDQVVDDRDARTLPGELPHELRTDETGAAGHNRGFPRAHRIIRGESEYGRAASVE